MDRLKLKKLIKVNSILFYTLLLKGCIIHIRVENYFLPKGFEGNVAVIYEAKIKENQEVYNFSIPSDGILRTPFAFHEGHYQINYYQKNDSNSYDTLFEELPMRKIDTSKNRIYFNRVLSFEKYKSKERHTVNTFYVGKKKATELANDIFFFEERLEKIVFSK